MHYIKQLTINIEKKYENDDNMFFCIFFCVISPLNSYMVNINFFEKFHLTKSY